MVEFYFDEKRLSCISIFLLVWKKPTKTFIVWKTFCLFIFRPSSFYCCTGFVWNSTLETCERKYEFWMYFVQIWHLIITLNKEMRNSLNKRWTFCVFLNIIYIICFKFKPVTKDFLGLIVKLNAHTPFMGKTASWHVIVQKSYVAMCTAVAILKVWSLYKMFFKNDSFIKFRIALDCNILFMCKRMCLYTLYIHFSLWHRFYRTQLHSAMCISIIWERLPS